MTKIPAKRAAAALRNALDAEGVQPGDFYSREIMGWVPPNYMNSLELGLKPTAEGRLQWFVGVNGDGIVDFVEDPFNEGEHSPDTPEKMHPYFQRAFGRLGLKVIEFRNDRWSSDETNLGYTILTDHPEWLEPYSPKNEVRPEHDGALVTVSIFDDSPGLKGMPAYLMKDGSFRIPRATVDAIAALKVRGEPICTGGVDTNGQLFMKRVVAGRASTIYTAREPLVDFWGNKVDAWEIPARLVRPESRFQPSIPYEVNGRSASDLGFTDLDPQYGPAPWSDEAAAPAPGR